jgi:hypothetical protein
VVVIRDPKTEAKMITANLFVVLLSKAGDTTRIANFQPAGADPESPPVVAAFTTRDRAERLAGRLAEVHVDWSHEVREVKPEEWPGRARRWYAEGLRSLAIDPRKDGPTLALESLFDPADAAATEPTPA